MNRALSSRIVLQLISILEWYSAEAASIKKNLSEKKDSAVLASVNVLSLDAGRRGLQGASLLKYNNPDESDYVGYHFDCWRGGKHAQYVSIDPDDWTISDGHVYSWEGISRTPLSYAGDPALIHGRKKPGTLMRQPTLREDNEEAKLGNHKYGPGLSSPPSYSKLKTDEAIRLCREAYAALTATINMLEEIPTSSNYGDATITQLRLREFLNKEENSCIDCGNKTDKVCSDGPLCNNCYATRMENRA